MQFYSLNEVSAFFTENLFQLIRSSTDDAVIDGRKYTLTILKDTEEEGVENIVKLSYHATDDEDDEIREYILAFITSDSLVVNSDVELEEFTFKKILSENLFDLSLMSLVNFHHIWTAVDAKYPR